jgi:hypothetical protein
LDLKRLVEEGKGKNQIKGKNKFPCTAIVFVGANY